MTGRGITGRDLGENEGQGKGDYSRAAIILSISVKGGGGGDYSREAINRRTAIIRGNTVCRLK